MKMVKHTLLGTAKEIAFATLLLANTVSGREVGVGREVEEK
jgi:hypothetical protein